MTSSDWRNRSEQALRRQAPAAESPIFAFSGGAAIILWNTVYLGWAIEALHRQGEIIPNELLAHLAPLGWQHINLTGDYLSRVASSPGPAEFRELGTVIDRIAA